ncbi:class I SAM-dependent methyltransferase [Oscillatoria salina]|uniref:class I SAM-dependent methyltransferase n=1 Tax=Oscillatoria salina TaxID=331517 RepID=UPI001CCC1D18|nr:class I SAM-dependent methyltransferase [Oscillatoria salina]MBZ8183089.1 class I SAM-dependent methyltransferase [Oscillatoria salina IIICB1]
MNNALVDKKWDYSKQARFYSYRPSYSARAIDALIAYVGAKGDHQVVDIGAGTGNLSIMLLERGLRIVSIEPNDAMREIGIKRSGQSDCIRWIRATGAQTTLADRSSDWVTFGSSLSAMDSYLTMKETYRILKDDGFFTCIGNRIDFNDPIQKVAEAVIVSLVPDYDSGARRDWGQTIEASNLFRDVFHFEANFSYEQTIDRYVKAWRSVRNRYWDLATPEGQALFEQIADRLRSEMPETFTMHYTTRAWTAQS